MNDKPERYYTLEIVKEAAKQGVLCRRMADTGRRKLNGEPYDNLLVCPSGKAVFIEAKIKNADLTESESDFRALCTELGVPHCILRIFPDYFIIDLNSGRFYPDYTLFDVVKKIGEENE